MYPVLDNESWLGIKSEPVEDTPALGNVARSWQWRERGTDPTNYPPNKKVFENIAEDILVQKPLQIRSCDLPGYPRSTFLMVFSPDGTKVASTHGNHNVYVSELASGKHVRILKGHPRTPWCIAFHPSHPQLIGSGCLGGQVRVWDIASGGSEVWNVRNETVIASIAFHPREQLLVIATYNELYFWDWSHPAPFTKVATKNINEKVRFVAFDSLGYKLITGISLWACPVAASSHPLSSSSSSSSAPSAGGASPGGGGDSRPPESPGAAQDMIVNSYQTLVQRYDSLVRNYQRLFMVRHRLANSPPPNNTIDRGTDPMESYPMDIGRRRRAARRSMRTNNDTTSPSPSSSRRQDAGDSGDGESSSSRLLNLDVLSFDIDSDTSRPQESPTRERSPLGSRSSAFQPLITESMRAFRTVDQSERTRLLPNPFSSRAGGSPPRAGAAPRARRFVLERSGSSVDLHASRTSIFASSRSDSALGPDFLVVRRRSSPRREPPPAEPAPSTSAAPAAPPPATTNSSTQMSPDADNVDAHSINESLDLIRDILRDSGTRLLNLITNMSVNLMSEHGERGGAAGVRGSPRMRLLADDLHRDLFASSSDSDSDHTDILRTPNSAFREPEATTTSTAEGERAAPGANPPTDRMVFELDDVALLPSSRFRVRTQAGSPRAAGEQVAPPAPGLAQPGPSRLSPSQPGPSQPGPSQPGPSQPSPSQPGPSQPDPAQPGPSQPSPSQPDPAQPDPASGRPAPTFDPNVPSTSRDTLWSRAPRPELSSAEAMRRVRRGVNMLHKHALELAHTWLRGERLTMKQLRTMWENLRRRVLALQRETGRQDSPGYYTCGLFERCMILTDMSDVVSRHRNPRAARTDDSQRNSSTAPESGASSESAGAEPEPGPSADARPHARPTILRSSRSSSGSRASPFFRRRLQSYRYQSGDGRGGRNLGLGRVIIGTTKHEIRMRAMQVLSVMFNMMMMCLGERGLSQVIMHMLKALKKALALSCFMIMSRNSPARPVATAAPSSQDPDAADVVRIQNAEHGGPVNVDGPDDPASPRVALPPDDAPRDRTACKPPAPTQASVAERDTQKYDSPAESPDFSSQKWSHRLAVQIAAANRNTSSTARTRRELYLESKRQKALHRTNPAAHPFVRRRYAPLATHRIPALRRLPSRRSATRTTPRVPPTTPRVPPPSDAQAAGPSGAPDGARDAARDDSSDFDNRVNLIRIAHMQAVRLRNAARNRFRRLQTIRLYTPSSVFSLQSNANENQAESRESPQNGAESSAARRPFVTLSASASRGEVPRPGASDQFHAVLNNVAVPLMQVNDLPAAADGGAAGSPAQRLPRIHEYLQPIILAQNAMVVEEEGEGGGGGAGGLGRRMAGMAGLLDAGIISEALPAPSNRVQAWDFTSGQTPDIADNTKNVVVQRCRIHNDASIDISKDGRLLVALLPGTRLRNTNSWLGVYSLEWGRLGQCLHTAMLEQSAVSVALSPTARYLAVGLGSRRFTSAPHARSNIIALLYKLDPLDTSSRTGLSPIKELMQHWEHGFTSLNCLRWAPQPGQGLVYANNTGQLIIMS